MLRAQIISICQKLPTWCSSAQQEYVKRLNSYLKLNISDLPIATRSKSVTQDQAISKEGQNILAKINSDDYVIALDPKGKQLSNTELLSHYENWHQLGKTIKFIIGGPDGLSSACLQRADFNWSLSKLILPHGLARVFLLEQLYRVASLANNHPYHR